MNNQTNNRSKKRFNDAIRLYKNGKATLKRTRVYYDLYQDAKPVHGACGIAYLAVLKALEGYFMEKGVEVQKLPRSFEGYEFLLKRHFVHNGKVRATIFQAYQVLHVAGYYQGITDTRVIKAGFQSAKFVIEKLSRRKVI